MDDQLAKKLAVEACKIDLSKSTNKMSDEEADAARKKVGDAGELLTESVLRKSVDNPDNDLLWIKLDNSSGWLYDKGFENMPAKRADYLLSFAGKGLFLDSKFKTFHIRPGGKYRVNFEVNEIEKYKNLASHFDLNVTLIVWVRKSLNLQQQHGIFPGIIIHLEQLKDNDKTEDGKYYFVDTPKTKFFEYSFPD